MYMRGGEVGGRERGSRQAGRGCSSKTHHPITPIPSHDPHTRSHKTIRWDQTTPTIAHSLTELQPPRGVRPKTTTAVARRLIGHALGVAAAVRCPKAEAELAEARRQKREERRARQAGQSEAWGG